DQLSARGSMSGFAGDSSPGSRADEGTSGTLSGARSRVKDLGAANATIYQLDNLRFIAIEGTINETFDPRGVTGELFGRVVLDLTGVQHITSFGVRGWLDMM